MKNYSRIFVFSFIVAAAFSSLRMEAAEQEGSANHDHHGSTVKENQDPTPAFHKHFKDAKHWAKSFEDPERDKWQKPDEVIKLLGIKAGTVVADLGAGTGYFSIRMAKAHPEAKIIGADIEPDMVAYLEQQAQERKLTNLSAYKIDAAKPELPAKAGLALMVDTFHHIDNRVDYLKNLAPSLAPKGQVALIDFTKASPIGPPAKHRIEPEEVIAQFKAAGYDLQKRFDDLPNQYFLLFQKHE
ncbi:MAG: class I SAM-dependent methyltransferase [Candidatus Obscuribacterales bacterium]|jgi:ubiquinone/menaquinone biosynthesis C-methylase UbiE|nr:class I SAM-dependent methyltransferase [Candidatus Obscuribacterales bacterium]